MEIQPETQLPKSFNGKWDIQNTNRNRASPISSPSSVSSSSGFTEARICCFQTFPQVQIGFSTLARNCAMAQSAKIGDKNRAKTSKLAMVIDVFLSTCSPCSPCSPKKMDDLLPKPRNFDLPRGPRKSCPGPLT